MAAQRTRQQEKVLSLLKDAAASLERGELFGAETAALQAMERARRAGDFARLAEAIALLRHARAKRIEQATAASPVQLVTERLGEGQSIESGVYLVRPPRVALDARTLRDAAFDQGAPVVVLTREPVTKTGHWPIVALGPVTVRTQVDPPPAPRGKKVEIDDRVPTPGWVLAAIDALADEALDTLKPNLSGAALVDHLLERLAAVPESLKLHDEAISACRDAVSDGSDEEE